MGLRRFNICKVSPFGKIFSSRGQAASLIIIFFLIFVVFLLVNLTHLEPRHFILFFLGVIIFIIAFIKTRFAIGIFIFSMLLSPELNIGSIGDRTVVLRFDDMLLFVIFIAWLARLSIYKELGLLKKTVLNIPIRNYIFVCLVATGIGFMFKQQSVARSFFYLFKYFEYFMLYFLVVNNLESKREIKVFIFLMILTCVITSAYGLYYHHTTGDRATAPFEGLGGEPNTLAGYLIILSALCMGLLFHMKSAMPVKLGLILALGLGCLALVFTFSRGGWLSFIVMYLVMIVLVPRYRPFLILVAALLLALAPLITPEDVKSRFTSTFIRSAKSRTFHVGKNELALDESGSNRLNSLAFGFKEFTTSPIIGHGIPTLALVDTQFTRTMMETGLLGIVTFGVILLRIYNSGRYALWIAMQADDGFAQGVCVGFLAGFIGLLVHSFSAASFIIIRIMEPFWFLTAIVVSIPFLYKASDEEKGGSFGDVT